MARGAAACWGSVIREGLVLVTIGLGLGMAGALVLTKLMGAVIFDPPIAPLPPAGAWLASRLPSSNIDERGLSLQKLQRGPSGPVWIQSEAISRNYPSKN